MEVEEKIAEALHPPRCPKCGEELWKLIDHLNNGDKLAEAYLVTDPFNPNSTHVYCPKCNSIMEPVLEE